MKKNTLITIILGTIGGLITLIGMCMCLVEEWNLLKPGIVTGVIGLLILFCIYPIYRKNHPKEKKEVNGSLIVAIVIGILGSLVMGFGMSKCLIPDQEQTQMILGLVFGIAGLLICVLDYPIYAYIKSNKN